MNGETLSGLGGELKASPSMFGKMLDDLVRDAGGPGFFWQLLVLAGCLAMAWPLGRYVVRRLEARYASSSFSLRFAAASLERAMFPLAGWVLVMIAGFPIKRIAIFGGGAVAALVLAYLFYDNARHRIDSFLGGGTAFDRADDVVIAGTATEIALELLADRRLVDLAAVAVHDVDAGHDHAGRTEAALQRVMLAEGFLHGM